MIALLQRVSQAQLCIAGQTHCAIERGVVALIGVERADTAQQAERLAQRILAYRLFADAQERMNLSLHDLNAGLMLVPQFTLAADTRKGHRPSFTPAAPSEQGQALFTHLLHSAQAQHQPVVSGVFGADMQVHLVNDGPVTFWLQVQARDFA